MPKRIQMRRARPWRDENPGAVVVARGHGRKWGNPCKVDGDIDREYASAVYANWISGGMIEREIYGSPPSIAEIRAALAGKDLACWCDHAGHCHADVLLHVANAPTEADARALFRQWRVFGPYISA